MNENVGKRPSGHLLTVEELAGVLSVPKSWVYARTATGEIPHVRVGRYKRFVFRDVMQWLEDSHVRQ